MNINKIASPFYNNPNLLALMSLMFWHLQLAISCAWASLGPPEDLINFTIKNLFTTWIYILLLNLVGTMVYGICYYMVKFAKKS